MAHVVDVSDEEVEEVDHPNVGDNDLIDDIDNYSSENDIDDDVDMNEPFTNIDSKLDLDTYVEMDEEEDDWYLIVEKKRYVFISFVWSLYVFILYNIVYDTCSLEFQIR